MTREQPVPRMRSHSVFHTRLGYQYLLVRDRGKGEEEGVSQSKANTRKPSNTRLTIKHDRRSLGDGADEAGLLAQLAYSGLLNALALVNEPRGQLDGNLIQRRAELLL